MEFLEFLGVLMVFVIGAFLPRTVLGIVMGALLGGDWWVLCVIAAIVGLIFDCIQWAHTKA